MTTTSTEAFTEHYLQPYLGQSRIDGRLGGSACTIIAMLTAHRFLCRILALQMSHEKGGQLLTESIDVFLGCIRQGNHIYDSCRLKGLLSVEQNLSALCKVPIELRKFFFTSLDSGWHQLVVERLQAAHQSLDGLAAGVLITSPYSIMLGCSSAGSVYVLDSHSHGSDHGALISVFLFVHC